MNRLRHPKIVKYLELFPYALLHRLLFASANLQSEERFLVFIQIAWGLNGSIYRLLSDLLFKLMYEKDEPAPWANLGSDFPGVGDSSSNPLQLEEVLSAAEGGGAVIGERSI